MLINPLSNVSFAIFFLTCASSDVLLVMSGIYPLLLSPYGIHCLITFQMLSALKGPLNTSG